MHGPGSASTAGSPGERGWLEADGILREATAGIVGARPDEVATLNTLTVNLHLLLAAFFRPVGRRTAILIDAPTFPSDRYAVDLQLRHHGLDPAANLIVVRPRAGELLLRVEDLEGAIHDHRDRLALTLLAGVSYATGQLHDIERLTGAIRTRPERSPAGTSPTAPATCRWVSMTPASISPRGARTSTSTAGPARSASCSSTSATRRRCQSAGSRAGGATTRRPASRWRRPSIRRRGAAGWRISTPPILSLAPIGVSLAMFDEVGMTALRERSVALTAFLEMAIEALVPDAEIVTPRDPTARGSQLSIRLPDAAARLAAIETLDVAADFREPDIVRMAPVPLYVSYHDAWRAARALADTAPSASTRRSPP